jgi:hypothetical protein
MGGGRAWVSGSLQPLSECGCSSRRRKTVPPSGCRVAVFPLPTPCAAGRLSISVVAQAPSRRCAAQECRSSPVDFYQILNKFAKFAKQHVRRALPPRSSCYSDPGPALGTTSRVQAAQGIGRWWILTCDCGVRRWCMVRDTAEELF